MAGKDSDYYVAIEDPKLFRRELLSSTKVIVKLLQKYEEIKIIRENKIKLTFKYSNTITEINMLVNKLKRLIPRAKINNIPNFENVQEEPKIMNSKSKFQARESKPISKIPVNNNIEDLHNQLSEIEARLNSLSQ